MRLPTQAVVMVLCWLLPHTTVAHAGWKLTFSDEFDGAAVDTSKWKFSDLWGNQTLFGNGEKQCYVPRAVTQANGMLRLEASRSVTPAAACKGAASDLPFVSGMVTTGECHAWEFGKACNNKAFNQAYGYFEMRARLPKGKGLWPAFWLVPADGSWPPEIDIVEVLGHSPSTIFQTYHYFDATNTRQKAGGVYQAHDVSSTFSTFGLDWRPELLIWYVDGRESFRFSGPGVTAKSMYVLLNLAVGGSWPGDPDATTAFPAAMEVDYVRVFERINDGKPDDLPPSAPAPKSGAASSNAP